MREISWELFYIYNYWKDHKKLFEDLCFDYFRLKNKVDEFIVIEPNNPWIETQPIKEWKLWFQSKYCWDINTFISWINKSFKDPKIKIYESLKEIEVFTNISFNTNNKKIAKIKKDTKDKHWINCIFRNWPSFLKELENPEFYNIRYKYFWVQNYSWFFSTQIIKADYEQFKFDKKQITIKKGNTKISINKLLNPQKKVILLEWKPASWKSYLISYLTDILSNKFIINKHIGYFPIAISLHTFINWSIIDFINNRLEKFWLQNINQFSDVYLFLDWANELPYNRQEELINSLDEIKWFNNIKNILVTSRFWSKKNMRLEEYLHDRLSIERNQEFNAENYVWNYCFKNYFNLNILNNKKDNLFNFLGKLTLSLDWYNENSSIDLESLQKNIKKDLWISHNNQINEFVDFLIDSNVFLEIWDDKLIFSDQKIYEYFLTNYLSLNFSQYLPKFRSLWILSQKEIMKQFEESLNKNIINKNYIWDTLIKNLFLDKYHIQSWINAWWAYDYDDIFMNTLLSLTNYKILLSENYDFIEEILNWKFIYNLFLSWDAILGKKFYKEKVNRLKKVADEWDKFLATNPEDHEKRNKYNELNLDKFYRWYWYRLYIDKIFLKKEPNTQFFLKNWLDEYLWKYMFLLFKNNNLRIFKSNIKLFNNNDVLNWFVSNISNIENLDILINKKSILNGFFKKFKTDVSKNLKSISEVNWLDENRLNPYISYLIFFIIISKINLVDKTKEKIIWSIKTDNIFWKIWEFSSINKNISIKVLILYSLVDWDNFNFDSKKFNNRLPYIYSIIWLISYYIKNLDNIDIKDLLEATLKFNLISSNCIQSYYGWAYYIKNIILWQIYAYFLNKEVVWKNELNMLLNTQKNFNDKLTIYKQIIYNKTNIVTNNFLQELLNESENKNDFSYTDKADISILISYFYANLWESDLSIKYFNKSLNESYIRYWFRKDYFLDIVIETIEKWYTNSFLSDNELIEYYKNIFSYYLILIEHVDWKWVRHIPTLLLESISRILPNKFDEFINSINIYSTWYYSIIWIFYWFYNKINNLYEIDDLYEKIEKFWEWFTERWNEDTINLCKFVLFVKLYDSLFIQFYPFYKNDLETKIKWFSNKYESIDKLISDIDYKIYWNMYEKKWLEWIIDKFKSDWIIEIDFEKSSSKKETVISSNSEYIDINTIDLSNIDNLKWVINKDTKTDLSNANDLFINNIIIKSKENWINLIDSYLFSLEVNSDFRYSWKKLWERLWMSFYKQNKSLFNKLINNKLENNNYQKYFTNTKLISELLILEKKTTEFKKFIKDIFGILELMCK